MMSKHALITGGNRGIGKEVARQLHERGFDVTLTARDVESGNIAATEIGCSFLQLDVDDSVSIRKAADEFAEKNEKLDVLINNAGVFPDGELSILDIEGSFLFNTLTTNTLGPLLVARFFRPFLSKSSEGRLINLSSALGQLETMEDHRPTYSISKTALNAVTRQLASALAGENIAVNSVSPGWVNTEMGGPDAPRSVEEGADTIVWLATEAPQDLTGQFLRDRAPIPW